MSKILKARQVTRNPFFASLFACKILSMASMDCLRASLRNCKEIKEHMAKRKNTTGIPDCEIESLARALLPAIQKFFESKEHQREFEEWQKQRRSQQWKKGA